LNGVKQLTNNNLVYATDSDIAELINFLIGMHDEAETLYPPYDKFLMSKFIKPIVADKLCILLKEDQKIIGAMGGIISRWWFSHNEYLGDAFFYIAKEHRSYQNASALVKGFNDIANKKLIPCLIGTADGNDLDRKSALYEKLGFRKIGDIFANGV
jgi:hypothetical protein